jgi:hypothetical protein
MSAKLKANRRDLDEPRCVIAWRREYREPLATIGIEISHEIHRIATERLAPSRTNSGQDQQHQKGGPYP